MADNQSKVIRNGTVWQGPERGFIPGLDVVIEGAKISRVGAGTADDASLKGAQVLDATGHLVIPGFVNAHTHVAMTLLRSFADDLPLQEWLTTKIWPVEAGLTAEDVYWGTMLGIVEMIRAGVTTFADMYFYMEDVARAVEETGIRASLAMGMFDGPAWEKQFSDACSLAESWDGGAAGRIKVMLGPHSPYATLNGLSKVAAAAEELGVGVHIHLSETKKEVEESLATHSLSPIAVAEREGIFRVPTLAAHCVHLSDEDFEILIRNNVCVAHNPTSNMKLGSGKAPVQKMLDRGVCVALATDGASSNNNLDLLEEARLAAYLAKMDQTPAALPAPVCLEMATAGGARALGFDDVGLIAAGYQADILLIRTEEAHWMPPFDPCANLIYSAHSRDVSTVLVAGRIIMHEREIAGIDEERVLYEASRRALSLVDRAKG